MENQISTAGAAQHIQPAAAVAAATHAAAAQTTTNTVAPAAAKAENTGAIHLDLGVANTEAISTDPNVALPKLVNANDVHFVVKYSSEYKGQKLMPEGKIILSKESAAHFQNIGIGKIVK